MRGHATLVLAVTREGVAIGRGKLLPGHFANLEQGYRVGFAGLQKWSEVDVSRRTYGSAVLAGTVLALGGAVLWPFAAWETPVKALLKILLGGLVVFMVLAISQEWKMFSSPGSASRSRGVDDRRGAQRCGGWRCT